MTKYYQDSYNVYKDRITKEIKEKDFCCYAEFLRLGKNWESASQLHELDMMEYYAQCLVYFKGLVNLETKRSFNFSTN